MYMFVDILKVVTKTNDTRLREHKQEHYLKCVIIGTVCV